MSPSDEEFYDNIYVRTTFNRMFRAILSDPGIKRDDWSLGMHAPGAVIAANLYEPDNATVAHRRYLTDPATDLFVPVPLMSVLAEPLDPASSDVEYHSERYGLRTGHMNLMVPMQQLFLVGASVLLPEHVVPLKDGSAVRFVAVRYWRTD